jgi:hypothetical protein
MEHGIYDEFTGDAVHLAERGGNECSEFLSYCGWSAAAVTPML